MAQMVATQMARKAGMAAQMQFDSAGTQASRMREPADPRTIAALESRDYPTAKTRSRRITADDFVRFDLILAMDQSNLNDMLEICPGDQVHKLRLFLDFASDLEILEVPDPYFGGPKGFERVLELCEAAAAGLIRHIKTGSMPPTR